jgi:hypothetical protein
MKVTLDIDNEMIKGLLCCAFEGGSYYWCNVTAYEYAPGLKAEDFRDGGKFQTEDYFHPSQIIPLVEGCNVILHDKEDNDKRYILNIQAIHNGLNTMAKDYPYHFGNFISKNDDAITGDVFLQCCVFGKVIYG